MQHIWLRLLGGGSRGGEQQRLVKELLESLHVMARVMDHVETDLPASKHPEPITVLDLCSGFGYLSMFLAELLPANRVDKIILLDKAWPMHTQDLPTPGEPSSYIRALYLEHFRRMQHLLARAPRRQLRRPRMELQQACGLHRVVRREQMEPCGH